ncbi:MAG: hypothetical protein HUJ31_02135, partial [Pseudomonadales bacterium]|nr:hypothetical protein [Pseudomonadales bacterium]
MRWLIVVLVILTDGCNDKDTDRDQVPVEVLPVTTLVQGDQPTLGNEGPRELRVIRDEDAFANAWFDYTPNELPSIDFQENVVVLYDRGSTETNQCSWTPQFKRVSAELFDESILVVTVHLEQHCEQVKCLAYSSPGSPFLFVSVPKSYAYDVLVSLAIDIPECGEQSNEEPVGISTLVEGDHPVIGDFGSPKMMVINDQNTLSLVWPEYSDDDVPQIDFTNKAVVLHDGGFSNLNPCSLETEISSVTAEKYDVDIGTEITTVK